MLTGIRPSSLHLALVNYFPEVMRPVVNQAPPLSWTGRHHCEQFITRAQSRLETGSSTLQSACRDSGLQ